MSRIPSAVALCALVLSACANDVAQPDITPQFGKTTVADPTTDWYFPLSATGLALVSDGKYVSGSSSVYANGVCGVTGKLFATTAASNSGDATLQTDNPASTARKCADYPRKFTLAWPDGTTELLTGFFANLGEIQNTTTSIPIGTTALKGFNMPGGARCGTLRFRYESRDNTRVFGADYVAVTRVDARTWDVATQPAPANRAYCDNTGELIAMPVSFRIVASYNLP